MDKNKITINILKSFKDKLLEKENKRKKCDIKQFYEDSLNFLNVANGMVILITESEEIRKIAYDKTSHEQVCQDIFDNMDVKHIDFSKINNSDFANFIPKEYNTIFIRMASILNGPTFVYYPDICNNNQIETLEKFNEEVKAFNSTKKKHQQVVFEYNGKSEEIKNDLDELIEKLKKSQKKVR